jgi:hypothetical protein
MKKIIKASTVILVIFAVLFAIVYTIVLFKGKSIAIAEIEKMTRKKVTIGYLGLVPPVNIQIINLNIEGMFRADSIYVSPSIIGFLTGNAILNKIKIKNPEFTYELAPPAPQVAEVISAEGVKVSVPVMPAPPTKLKPEEKAPLRLAVKYINIKGGKINFVDRVTTKEGIKLALKNINFTVHNLYLFPTRAVTNFDLRAAIPWREGAKEGKMELEGWVNLFKKDIRATFKIQDIDGVYLYPYYNTWVDLGKARIQSATLNFTSDIHGLNNDVAAECHLELSDIVRRPLAPDEGQEKAARITDAVLDIFRTLNGGKIDLNFTVRTKLDKPAFGFSNIRMAFEEKLMQGRKSNGGGFAQDVIMFPGKLIEGTVKSATDITKSVISGTVDVGKEIKKAVEDTFTKQPAETNPEPQPEQPKETNN